MASPKTQQLWSSWLIKMWSKLWKCLSMDMAYTPSITTNDISEVFKKYGITDAVIISAYAWDQVCFKIKHYDVVEKCVAHTPLNQSRKKRRLIGGWQRLSGDTVNGMFIYQLHAIIKRGHAARKLNEMADGGRSDCWFEWWWNYWRDDDDGGETDGDRIKVAADY